MGVGDRLRTPAGLLSRNDSLYSSDIRLIGQRNLSIRLDCARNRTRIYYVGQRSKALTTKINPQYMHERFI